MLLNATWAYASVVAKAVEGIQRYNELVPKSK